MAVRLRNGGNSRASTVLIFSGSEFNQSAYQQSGRGGFADMLTLLDKDFSVIEHYRADPTHRRYPASLLTRQ